MPLGKIQLQIVAKLVDMGRLDADQRAALSARPEDLSGDALDKLLQEEFKVASFALLAAKAHIEAQGVEVLGPTYHGIFRSIYFFDPNGHRLELACNIGTAEQHAELKRVAPLMLEEWSRTKTAPRHADWLHTEPVD